MFPSHKPSSFPRRRSLLMHETLRELGYQITTQGTEYYIAVGDANYRILDGSALQCNQPLISIDGRVTSREMIFFDPASPYLNSLYTKLASRIRPGEDVMTVLNTSIDFVKRILFDDDKSILQSFCEDRNNQMALYDNNVPIVTLDAFIKNHIGVCRHHALFMSYLLHKLIQNGLLPLGDVFHHRYDVPREPHIWAMYKPNGQVPVVYLVDSLWNEEAFDLSKNLTELIKLGYGAEAITDCVSRYKLNLKSIPYSASYPKEIKDAFLSDLLNTTPQKRQEYLNYQYALNRCADLKSELESLKTKGLTSAFASRAEFPALCDALDQVLKTSILHCLPYSECKDVDQPQFIAGLLFAFKVEREFVLKNQSISDLKQISLQLSNTKNSLNDDKKVVCDRIMTEDIPKCIHLKTLKLIDEIILSGKLEISSDNTKKASSSFWNKKIGEIYVSKSCKEIHDKITDFKPDVADFTKVNDLIISIQKTANDSLAKKKNKSTGLSENKKSEFFAILRDKKDPGELFNALNEFHKKIIPVATPPTVTIKTASGPG